MLETDILLHSVLAKAADMSSLDILWILVSAGLVFLMQGGFLCLETGLTRNKNNINVAIKNITDFGLTTVIFWMFGYALMFGRETWGGWLGVADFFPSMDPATEGALLAFLIFQVMFCGTAVTIMSGAVAERMRFESYIFITILISGLVYPVFGHWAWAGIQPFDGIESASGWLYSLGFVDFAGSTVVHSVGGWASLAILLIIGARTGRFDGEENQKIQGANLPLAALGVMLLWVGWFGFNGGSQLGIDSPEDTQAVVRIITNTVIAGSVGLVAAMFVSWFVSGRANVDMVMNGTLAGLVAITANCHAVSTAQAVFIGAVGGVVMVGVTHLLEYLKIDDAVGAVPVHLGAGVWGTLAVGLFAAPDLLFNSPEAVANFNRSSFIMVQLLGIVVCGLWTFLVTYLVMSIYNRMSPLRVSIEEEQVGLNISEHGARTDLVDLFTVMDEQSKTGDLTLRVPIEPFTQVGMIATRYNAVMDALEVAIARTDAIVQTAMDGILTFTRDALQIESVNPAGELILGYQSSELRGQPMTMLMDVSTPNGEVATPRQIADVLDSLLGSNDYREVLGRRADGTVFPMEVTVAEVETGEDRFFTATFRDITERKRVREELQRQNVYLSSLHETTLALMNRLDLNDLLVNLVQRAAEISNTKQGYIYLITPNRRNLELRAGVGVFADYIGTQLAFGDGLAGHVYSANEPKRVNDYANWPTRSDLYSQQDFGPAIAVPLRVREERLGVFGLARLQDEPRFTPQDVDLLTRFAELAAIALDNAQLYTSAQQEIQERRRTQQELEEARDVAESANRAKSVFLANMSHELRTPLNAIIGYSEMLQEDAEDMGYDDFVTDLDKIRSAGGHLLDLINSVLDLSKIEAGKMELYLEPFDLVDTLQTIAVTVQQLVYKNNNTFTLDIPEDIGSMTADLTKVRQVLFNLLSNAAKFTENGDITLAARRITHTDGDWITFTVRDDGIGMTQDQMNDVFNEFTQADVSTTRKYGGTGLGLAICYRFCQMMNGDLTVSSVYGEGSVFTASLPAIVIDTEKPGPTEPASQEDDVFRTGTFAPPEREVGTMLVVDDDPVVRDIIVRFMMKQGYRVLAAESGEEGLKLAQEMQPDVITLDVLMPGRDGLLVLSELKKNPETADIPVIMMSMADNRTMGFSLGADAFLEKPVNRGRLLDIVRAYVGSDIQVNGATVLVVEDAKDLREVMQRTLQKEGITVLEAENGRRALDLLEQGAHPDLILLDLMMPEMDGFQFIELLRQRPAWEKIPVVVVTAQTLTNADQDRLRGSVERVLSKGAYDRNQLLNEVNRLVANYISRKTDT